MSEPLITFTTLDGLRIAETCVGDGVPLLLLHGWGANIGLMWPLGEALSRLWFAGRAVRDDIRVLRIRIGHCPGHVYFQTGLYRA